MSAPFYFMRLPFRWHWNVHHNEVCVLCWSIPGLGFRWQR